MKTAANRVRDFVRANPILGPALALSFAVSCYWLLIAPDRYVSEAIVMVEKADLGGDSPTDLGTLIGAVGGASRQDQLVLQNFLLSGDMLAQLDRKLDLRSHYSAWHHDPFSRLWFRDISFERFLDYYRSRVTVEYDDYSGQLTIQAQAFDAGTAQAIAALMVGEGENYINDMAHRIASGQVSFLEGEVQDWQQKSKRAAQQLIDFQNAHHLLSPPETAQGVMGNINQLMAQKAVLEVKRATLLGYLTPNNPSVLDLDKQVEATEQQIAAEKAQLAAGAGTLNAVAEEYLRLKMEADFATDAYKTSLAALERGRVEAARTVKKVSVIEHPSLPEASMQPQRWLNALEFTLACLLAAGILSMLTAIVRDHRD